ncbi:ribosomal L1 domain-containing protein 1 isoform X1 [Eptesicus fuscus]|uniref:ribosomal L1 domain-containing protein 1 isoform X1 n=2 Tax=Eptesicus fuscus TaxID=29078 RepID=UPI0024044680|nr:ribosomal L1 domain-containing protein 1 isoform X1 [Eptesicus fuscus]
MEDSASTPPAASTATPASTSATPAAPGQLDKKQTRKAVEALLAHSRSRKNANGLLLNENENFFLMVVLWKIPSKELRLRLSLPHGIRSDLADICLFTKDEPNVTPEKTEQFYKKLLKKHGIKTISQIIPLRTLKKEYKAYEAKLRLLGSFDLFLSDARIRRLLPSHLGRHFYKRKKVPIPVNLKAKNLSKEINSSIGGTVLNISKSGSCSTIRIGHTGMQVQHITENIVAVTKKLSQKLPEKWESVKLLYVKTERSVALPIFSSFVSSWDEAKGMNISSLKKQEAKKLQKQKEHKKKQKEKKRNRKPMKRDRKSTSALPTEETAPKTCGSPVKGPGPQKKKTPQPKKKETCRIKAQNKVHVESEEEIPLLVPIGETPAKENVEVQKHATGEKSPVKSPGSNPPRGKKRKAFPALEMPKAPEPKTPGKGPGKKPKVKEEVEKQRNSPLGKKDPKQTPKKPEAKFFTTANKSAKKASHTPKQWSQKPKVPQPT